MSKLMTVLVVLLSLAVAGLFLTKHENARLRASLDRANNVASGQQATITMLKNQLHVAITRADKNELAQVALRQELENAAKREAQREKTITRLLNENEDFRRWYGADLPVLLYRLPAAAQAQRQIPQAQPLTLCGKEHFPMLNKPQLLRRLLALCGLLLLCSGVALSQLFQLQILSGEKYVRRSAEFLTTTSTVSAARGEILDRYGRPLVTNNTGFSLVLIYSSFWDGNDKRFDTLLDLTHRIQTAAVDATAKQNAAKAAAATDTSSDTSADAADSTDTSSDTPTDTAQAVSADTAAIPSINDRLPITQSAPFTYNSSSLAELSGYMKDSAKSLGLDAVTAAVDAAKQASETDPKTDENGNTIDQAAQVDATKLVSPTEFINAMRA